MKAVAHCPKCLRSIPLEDINVAADVALCRACGERWNYAEICEGEDEGTLESMDTPSGTWVSRSMLSFEVGASSRSWLALFLAPFTCVWSGASLGFIYGAQIVKGKWDLVLCLFGIPFLLGTLVLVPRTLMEMFGKVVVSSEGDNATIFTGIGSFGWRRRFGWHDVKSIRLYERGSSESGTLEYIQVAADKEYNFASTLSLARRRYMLKVLRKKWQGRGA